MKKTILFSLAGVLMAAAAFGAYGTNLPTGLNGKLSTKVKLDYATDGNKSGYVIGTSHEQGTRSYGSSSGDAALWTKDGTEQGLPSAPSGTGSADFQGSGWSTL